MTDALVVIDMQTVFADPGSGWATPDFASIVAPVAELITYFSPYVVFTRFVAPGQPQGAWAEYYRLWPFALVPPNDPCWQIVPELDPAGHQVVDRSSFGKWGPELRAATGDASQLFLAGVSTDCCVLSTAIAAADDGIAVRVITDACAGLSADDHRRALDAMALFAPLITLVDSEQLLGR